MSLARNALYNLFGALVPAALNVLTIPFIVRSLGVDDFGLLTLITAVVGYFALVDINVTASSTKFISQYKAAQESTELNQTLTFGLAFYASIGLIGCVVIWLSAPWLIASLFSLQADRQPLAIEAIRIAAAGFAVSQIQTYLQSIPGALMRFDVSGRIEAVFGTIVPVASVLWLMAGGGLVGLVWLRLIFSIAQSIVLAYFIAGLLGSFKLIWPTSSIRNSLLSFSGWAFLNRVAAITYSQADKMIVGARIGTADLTFFAVPATLVSRVMAVIYRLSGVMFPHASALGATGRFRELEQNYLTAMRYTFFLNGAIASTLMILAHPVLHFWIGLEMANRASLVLMLTATTILIESMTNLPSLINDGLGRPVVTGLVAAGRVALGLVCVYFGVTYAGIVGAAFGQLASAVVAATVFLWYVHGRSVPIPFSSVWRQSLVPSTIALVGGICVMLLLRDFAGQSLAKLVVVLVIALLVFALAAVTIVLLPGDRQRLRLRLAAIGLGRP